MALLTRNLVAGSTQNAGGVIDYLRAKAAAILKPALGTQTLNSFATGAYGNFPYYWQNPGNLQFNKDTYDWINANLAANTANPWEQANGSFFTNEFNTALGAIGYTLSAVDKQKLNEAAATVTNQQAALLINWIAIYGSLPNTTSPVMPIDAICEIICTQWASPATDLMKIQSSKNLNQLLNNTPASGQPILPLLANWVGALKESIPLQNAVSLNNGLLNAALAAIQTPSLSNGGSQIGNSVFPTYSVYTPVNDILNGLEATGNQIKLNMSISNCSTTEYKVQVSGGTSFTIPYLAFFGINMGGKKNWFQEKVSANASSLEIEMVYTGVTLVEYGPKSFDKSTGRDWYFMDPIKQAIELGPNNTTQSGYKFLVDPVIDFSENGPFGITTGCAIANHPSVTITVTNSNCQEIADAFSQDPYFKMSFLGIPFSSVSESCYLASCCINKAKGQLVISLKPPPAFVAGAGLNSRGWVLGVITEYPAAMLTKKIDIPDCLKGSLRVKL